MTSSDLAAGGTAVFGVRCSDYPTLESLARAELVEFAVNLFHQDGLARAVNADPVKLARFIEALSHGYDDNPYHCWLHAVDVARSADWLASRPAFAKGLPALDRFWFVISALCHDLGHPGHDNAWEVAIESDLARRYGTCAVLEKHSLELARELMAVPQNDFASTMTDEAQFRGATLMSELIRCTDLSTHREFLADFQMLIESCEEPVELGVPAVRLLVMKALMKAADMSNAARPMPEARRWAARIMAEIWAQERIERAIGLRAGPLNDSGRLQLGQAQSKFIRFAVLDLYTTLTKIEPTLEASVRTIEANLACYESSSA